MGLLTVDKPLPTKGFPKVPSCVAEGISNHEARVCLLLRLVENEMQEAKEGYCSIQMSNFQPKLAKYTPGAPGRQRLPGSEA